MDINLEPGNCYFSQCRSDPSHNFWEFQVLDVEEKKFKIIMLSACRHSSFSRGKLPATTHINKDHPCLNFYKIGKLISSYKLK